jgi:hypothetical protein
MTAQDASRFAIETLDRSAYFGKEYVYTVVIELRDTELRKQLQKNADVRLVGKRVLVVGEQNHFYVPTLLTHYIANPGEPHLPESEIVGSWAGFDGRETRRYHRKLLANFDGSIIESSGTIQSDVVYDETFSDPLFRTLFPVLVGPFLGKPLESEFVLYPHLQMRRQTNEVFGDIVKLHDQEWPFPTTYLTGPEFLTIEKFNQDGELEIDVQAITTIDGVRYPRKGKAVSTTWKGSYVLESVSPLSSSSGSWFPDWPKGTLVSNIDQNSTKLFPYDSAQIRKIRTKTFDRHANAHHPPVSSRRIFLLIINCALLGAICLLALRKRFTAR